jgi:hypothetical protein
MNRRGKTPNGWRILSAPQRIGCGRSKSNRRERAPKLSKLVAWAETSDVPVHWRLITTDLALVVKTHISKESRPLATRLNQSCTVIFFVTETGSPRSREKNANHDIALDLSRIFGVRKTRQRLRRLFQSRRASLLLRALWESLLQKPGRVRGPDRT